jgi:hypothetical protein
MACQVIGLGYPYLLELLCELQSSSNHVLLFSLHASMLKVVELLHEPADELYERDLLA